MRAFKVINPNYILTPFATAYFQLSTVVKRKEFYIFGIRIASLSV